MADTASASSRIFISYRREDSSGHVLALLPALRGRFGADRIFKDTDNIPAGADFVKFIRTELESCSVLLAIIGREWLTIQDPRLKRPRLQNPDDFLRVEVGTALRNERTRVIPVLVERSSMPAPEDLPPDLVDLAYRNAVELSDARWDADVRRLIEAIEHASAASPPTAETQPPARQDLIDLQKRRVREIAAQVKAAQEAFEAQDYDLALWACERALLLDPQQPEAMEILDRAKKTVDEQKITGWLNEARQLLKEGDTGGASDLIDQALTLDHTSEAALTVRKEMLALRRERERERERARAVKKSLERARASLDDGDFDGAVRLAEDALAVDANDVDAHAIKTKALAVLDERRRQRDTRRRAQQAIADARARFSAGDEEGALQLLRDFTPSHETVSQAAEQLANEAETQARHRHVDATVKRAAAALEAGNFSDALEFLSEVAGIDSGTHDIATLMREVQARHDAASAQAAQASRRRQADEQREAEELQNADSVAALIASGRQSLARGDHEAALRQATEALGLDERSEDARQLQNEAKALQARVEREQEERPPATLPPEQARAEGDRPAAEQRQPDAPDRVERETVSRESTTALAGGQSPEFAAGVRSSTRTRLAAVAVLVLVLSSAGGVWLYSRRSVESPPANAAAAPTDSPAAGTTGTDRGAASSGAKAAGTPPASSPSSPPVTAAPPGDAAAADPPGPTSSTPAGAGPDPVGPNAQRIDQLRADAESQLRKGQRRQALNSAVLGLQLAPGDRDLQQIVDSLLHEAERSTAKARTSAVSADAPTLARDRFAQALQLESNALRSRAAGREEEATRNFWDAATRFTAAANEAADATRERARLRQHEDERKEKALGDRPPPKANAGRGTGGSSAPAGGATAEEKKDAEDRPAAEPRRAARSRAEEDGRIRETLKRYETAYDNLDPAGVRAVYPAVRGDLPKIFASYQFYLLDMYIEKVQFSADDTAVASCRLFHTIQPKISARREQFEQRQDITLKMQGDTWVISDIRNR